MMSLQRVVLHRCLFGTLMAAAFLVSILGSPPEYGTFGRDQVLDYTPSRALLRIWCVYIGQGDSLLIQFPETTAGADPIEMLVDGGPGNQIAAFLKSLSPVPTKIESVVLTHHDLDHVKGLTGLLNTAGFSVGNFFHNGLASWNLGSEVFPGSSFPGSAKAVTNGDRGMAPFKGKGPAFEPSALVNDLTRLSKSKAGFTGAYRDLAEAALKGKGVTGFDRATRDHKGLAAAAPTGVTITPLWPPPDARGYGPPAKGKGTFARPDWSHSINGNSVAFRLDYGEFSMLFTGDLNEDSETHLLEELRTAGRLDQLAVDVLKIPHHGSSHGIKEFFDAVHPVLSVASMGSGGFMTKWKHPSTSVIRWLGGAHRVYSTYIHERPFDYAKLDKAGLQAMVETKHILIETDGLRFRIVEVEDPRDGIPTVREVTRSDGTRWIDAAGKGN